MKFKPNFSDSNHLDALEKKSGASILFVDEFARP
jgi:hypothetical protein